jgi:molecular chaperone HscA
VTVPAHFTESQRTATKRAASIAGVKVLRLLSEPAAAAIAFGLDKKKDGIFAVYDFGGGTFDFSILRLSNGVFQVLATGGDNYLGGDDVDYAILRHNFELNELDFSTIEDSEKMLGKLIAKSMKEQLIEKDIVKKNFVYRNNKYEFFVTKDIVKNIIAKYMKRTIMIADQVFRDAGLEYSAIDGIVLVGGMTKMQQIKDHVKSHFNVKIFDEINPEEVVAFGAAIQAESIASKSSEMLLIDVVPLTLGIETLGGTVDKIIHRNTPIPVVYTREYTTYKENQTGMKFHIVQGERSMAKDCRSIAHFELDGIPKMPSGRPRVNVEFCIDVNGLLNVTAREKATGVSQSVVAEPSSGLTDYEMVRILEAAAKNKESDNEESLLANLKIESERQMNFWSTIIKDAPENVKNDLLKEIELLKQSIEANCHNDILTHKKNAENIVGTVLDDIISDKLSKNPVKIIKT